MATCSACTSGVRLRWITPMPPACAMAMASRPSVTVSMAEDRIGILTVISRVTRELTSASAGSTSEGRGCEQHVVEGQRHGAVVQDGPLRHVSFSSIRQVGRNTGAPGPLAPARGPFSRPCDGIAPRPLLAPPENQGKARLQGNPQPPDLAQNLSWNGLCGPIGYAGSPGPRRTSQPTRPGWPAA